MKPLFSLCRVAHLDRRHLSVLKALIRDFNPIQRPSPPAKSAWRTLLSTVIPKIYIGDACPKANVAANFSFWPYSARLFHERPNGVIITVDVGFLTMTKFMAPSLTSSLFL